jgi:hypothetical protein
MDQRIESFLTDVLALSDLLDGFVLTVLIAVAIGSIHYGIRVVRDLRRAVDAPMTDARDEAYREYLDYMSNAWKGNPPGRRG